jgi:ketosteroid isomerase-like protein
MKFLIAALALSAPVSAFAIATQAQQPAASPAAAVEELLAADRSFATAGAKTNLIDGIAAMLDEQVIMPSGPNLLRGKAQLLDSLRANPANATAKAEWTPVRGGVSADGQQGFTFGYMTVSDTGKPPRFSKYLAYWVKRPEGWRVAAYKRVGRPAGEVSLAALPPAVPVKLVTPAAANAAYKASLIQAEGAFSDLAQRIGVGPAFQKNGSADAMNIGAGPAFTMGAEEIGRQIGQQLGGAGTESPIIWSANDALVSSSGDLGVTFGMIRLKAPPPEGQPSAVAFFTVWRRESPSDTWRYVAE